MAVDTGLKVVEECTLQGYEGVWGAANNTVIASEFEGIDGLRLAGVINGFPWWADAPPVEAYNTALETYGGGVDGRNPSATSTWAALELFRKAMGEYGPAADAEVTAADVVAAYQQVTDETLEGLLPSPTLLCDRWPAAVRAVLLALRHAGRRVLHRHARRVRQRGERRPAVVLLQPRRLDRHDGRV